MKKNKFTLIELMVVVAVIGILVSMLFPSLGKAREKGRRAVCISNQKQMGYGATMYAGDNKDFIPDWNGGSGGNRNLKHNSSTISDKTMGLGHLVKGKYIDMGAGPVVFYCPSRNPARRYGPNHTGFGWYRYAMNQTTEYSYQHRHGDTMNGKSNKDVFGADIAIRDNDPTQMTMGTRMSHSSGALKDGYYNVQFFDMSVRPYYDTFFQFDALFYNNCAGAISRFQLLMR